MKGLSGTGVAVNTDISRRKATNPPTHELLNTHSLTPSPPPTPNTQSNYQN